MYMRIMASILALVLFTGSVMSQTPVPPQPPAPPSSGSGPGSGSAVPGLELPADQTVNYDEGFVTLQAKTKGEVKWLVTAANAKVKYITVSSNSIIISVPPQGGHINVFAVALVDGKMTEFAKTSITVSGSSPTPSPNPVNPNQSLHLTFLIDMNGVTPDLAKLLNSESLRQGINQKGHWFRLYDIKSPIVAKKHLDQVAQRVGGNNVLVIQSNDGQVLSATAIPQNEQAIFALIQQVTGGK